MSSERSLVRRPCILADLLFSRPVWALCASLIASSCGQGSDGGTAPGPGGRGGTDMSGSPAGAGGSTGGSNGVTTGGGAGTSAGGDLGGAAGPLGPPGAPGTG